MSNNCYDDIRNMSDEELQQYLSKNYIKRNKKGCWKCSKKAVYMVKIENKDTFQTKKVCGLCEEHYRVLLKHLKVHKVDWD